MQINVAKLKANTEVVITDKDECFVGTDLEGADFEVVVKRLSKVEKIDTAQEGQDDEGNFSNGLYSKALFTKSIVDVVGIKNELGQELTIEDGVADIIWEYAPDALSDRIKEVIQSFNKSEQKKSESLETDSAVTPAG